MHSQHSNVKFKQLFNTVLEIYSVYQNVIEYSIAQRLSTPRTRVKTLLTVSKTLKLSVAEIDICNTSASTA